MDEEPQVTAEHVRLAEQAVRRAWAEPYIARAQTRMRALFLASMLWALFFGWVFGEYLGHGIFPWGTLGVAIAYSTYAFLVHRRNRD